MRPNSKTMTFVLVHGWGFGPDIWDPLAAHLGDAQIHRVDLGFLRGQDDAGQDSSGQGNEMAKWPDDAIAIGHSLGVLWLLHQKPHRFRVLVSLQGFDRFAGHIAPSRIALMRRGLERDPYGLMQSFWQSCGVQEVPPAEALNVPRLAEGLDWLAKWDESGEKRALGRPILALASPDDPIVPQPMSEAIWGEALLMSEPAVHLLPLRHPAWCAREIARFAERLPG